MCIYVSIDVILNNYFVSYIQHLETNYDIEHINNDILEDKTTSDGRILYSIQPYVGLRQCLYI